MKVKGTIALALSLVLFLQGCANNVQNDTPTQNQTEAKQSRLPVNANGVEISADLFINWSNKEERKQQLISLVETSLKKDKESFLSLIEFDCGGGAGCYDLGSVIAQVIYRITEQNAVEIVKDLSPKKAQRLHFLIGAGLEYGDNNYDEKLDNKLIENEFPNLDKTLRKLSKCEECP